MHPLRGYLDDKSNFSRGICRKNISVEWCTVDHYSPGRMYFKVAHLSVSCGMIVIAFKCLVVSNHELNAVAYSLGTLQSMNSSLILTYSTSSLVNNPPISAKLHCIYTVGSIATTLLFDTARLINSVKCEP